MGQQSEAFKIFYEIYQKTTELLKNEKSLHDLDYFEFGIYFKTHNKIFGDHVEYLLWVLKDFTTSLLTNYPDKVIVMFGRDDPVNLVLAPYSTDKFLISIIDDRHAEEIFSIVLEKKAIIQEIVNFSKRFIQDIIKINPNLKNVELIKGITENIKKIEKLCFDKK